jgi:hypothetical protein
MGQMRRQYFSTIRRFYCFDQKSPNKPIKPRFFAKIWKGIAFSIYPKHYRERTDEDAEMGLDVTGRYRYPPPDAAWLAKAVEPVLSPALPIIDAHHHLWEEGGHPYLLNDILADTTSGHHVCATVFVQAHYGYRTNGPAHLAPLGETEKVVSMRSGIPNGAPDIAAAIVAYADLTLGERLDEVIAGHQAIAGPCCAASAIRSRAMCISRKAS